jgi:hypothetical protein
MSARLTATEQAKIAAIASYSIIDEFWYLTQSLAFFCSLIDEQTAAMAARALIEAQQRESD